MLLTEPEQVKQGQHIEAEDTPQTPITKITIIMVIMVDILNDFFGKSELGEFLNKFSIKSFF